MQHYPTPGPPRELFVLERDTSTGSLSIGCDLVAVLQDLPSSTFVALLVAPTVGPLPTVPTSPFGLCLGAGGIGRYSLTPTDIAGVAVIPLVTSALPRPGGVVAAQPGETWSWQAVYRDLGTFWTTAALHVVLH